MALPRIVVVFLGSALALLVFHYAEGAGEMGVSYGRVASNLPPGQSVVQLLKQNGITMINSVAVGNEVFDSSLALTPDLVPAMTNVQAALAMLGLGDAIKVSTPIAFDTLKLPMPSLLQRTGSYLMINVYPFFAYKDHPDEISLAYALGNTNPGVADHDAQLTYYSLLDAQLDATYHAMEDLGFPGVSLVATETGWASSGSSGSGPPHLSSRILRGGRRRLLDAAVGAAMIANAQAYNNNNLINRVLAGKTGTPYRPNANMDVYISTGDNVSS
ncbi:hypothetical protein ACP4OV_027190 [Aristida adscensionis]